MSQSPTTRVSLVLRLCDPNDREAWGRFVALYAPLMYRFFRKRSLQDADAADLTQDVLQVVSQKVKTFSHQGHRGAFRAWLYTISKNRLRQFLAFGPFVADRSEHARRRRHLDREPGL